MLVNTLIGEDVLASVHRKIVVPVTAGGTNGTEMHIKLARMCQWPELWDTSFMELGDLCPHEFEGFVFYAAACLEYVNDHCLIRAQSLAQCLDTIETEGEEVLALVLMCVSREQLDLIFEGIEQSSRRVVVFLPEPALSTKRPPFVYPAHPHDRDHHILGKEVGLRSIF